MKLCIIPLIYPAPEPAATRTEIDKRHTMHVARQVQMPRGIDSHRYGIVRIPTDLAWQFRFLPITPGKPPAGDPHFMLRVVIGDILAIAVRQQTEADREPGRNGVNVDGVRYPPGGFGGIRGAHRACQDQSSTDATKKKPA